MTVTALTGRADDGIIQDRHTLRGLAPYTRSVGNKQKITISVPPEVKAEAEAAVADGRAKSISDFAARAMTDRAARDARARAIMERWGPFPDAALERAAEVLDSPGAGDDAMRSAS